MNQSLEDIAESGQGVVKSWLARFVSPHPGLSTEKWSPGLWFAALQRSAAGVAWHRKPWLLPSMGSALFGLGFGLVATSLLPLLIGTMYGVQFYTFLCMVAMLPAFAWQLFYSRWYFRRLLDQSTFEQLMITPLGSVAVLKDTILHLALQGLPVYIMALLGFFAAYPRGLIALFDYFFYPAFPVYVAGGAALGIQLALRVPLTEKEKSERRAKLWAALCQSVANFGRFLVRFGRFSARVLLPLAAIGGAGWLMGVYAHPALGWLTAMFGGMAFIVTLLIVASAKQIGTPMPPLPPLQEPVFRDLWEDRLRRYFDRGAVA